MQLQPTLQPKPPMSSIFEQSLAAEKRKWQALVEEHKKHVDDQNLGFILESIERTEQDVEKHLARCENQFKEQFELLEKRNAPDFVKKKSAESLQRSFERSMKTIRDIGQSALTAYLAQLPRR